VQPDRSVTTNPVSRTHISQARVFSQQQASSASSKLPQLPLDPASTNLATTTETAATSNLSQTQNTPVEFFDIAWRFYIIDYDVEPPHRFFTKYHTLAGKYDFARDIRRLVNQISLKPLSN